MQSNTRVVPHHLVHHRPYQEELEERHRVDIAMHEEVKQEREHFRNMFDTDELQYRATTIMS